MGKGKRKLLEIYTTDRHTIYCRKMVNTQAVKDEKISFLHILSLPRTALLRIFAELDFPDALSLALCHSTLLDIARQESLRRMYACVQCFNTLCDAKKLYVWTTSGGGHAMVSLDDGIAQCLGECKDFTAEAGKNISFGAERNCNSPALTLQMMEQFLINSFRDDLVKVRPIFCRCGLWLGVHLLEINGHRCDGGKRRRKKPFENWRYSVYLDRIFVVRKYMTLIRPKSALLPIITQSSGFHGPDMLLGMLEDGSLGATAVRKEVYECRGVLRTENGGTCLCRNVVFEKRAILSSDHVWKLSSAREGVDESNQNHPLDAQGIIPEVPAESAFYVNHVESPLVLSNERQLDLLQGSMKVADVACNLCNSEIGWRFIKCLEESGANARFEGRWGFVSSAVRKEDRSHARKHFENPIGCISRDP